MRQRLQPAAKFLEEEIQRDGVARRLHGDPLDDGQQVLRAVRQFAQQRFQHALAVAGIGNVGNDGEQAEGAVLQDAFDLQFVDANALRRRAFDFGHRGFAVAQHLLLDGAETDAVNLAEQGCVVAPQRRGGGGEMRRQIFDVTDAERIILLDDADSGTGKSFFQDERFRCGAEFRPRN